MYMYVCVCMLCVCVCVCVCVCEREREREREREYPEAMVSLDEVGRVWVSRQDQDVTLGPEVDERL